jgi:hypothetical protein
VPATGSVKWLLRIPVPTRVRKGFQTGIEDYSPKVGFAIESVSRSVLVQSIRTFFAAVQTAIAQIATPAVPLVEVESVWEHAAGRPRIVFTID